MSYVSRFELNKAYEDCIKKKRSTNSAINFEIYESKYLEELYVELNTKTYNIGKSNVFLLKNDQNIPYREVFAANFKDRIVHHLFINRIINVLEEHVFINDSYACRTGKGTLFGALQCKKYLNEASQNGTYHNVYIMKMDLKNCFNSFNKKRIYDIISDIIKKYINDRNIEFNLWLAEKIIMHCPQNNGYYTKQQNDNEWNNLPWYKSLFNCDDIHGIAVGNLTSQIFANTYLSQLDNFIVDTLGYKYYGRYVDDFYIIGFDKEQMLKDRILIEKFISSLDMEVSKSKFYFQHYKHGVNFIGYTIHYNRMYAKNSIINNLCKKLYHYNKICKTYVIKKQNIPIMNVLDIINSWNSYAGIFKYTNNRNTLKLLLNKYKYFTAVIKRVTILDSDFILHLSNDSKKLLKSYFYCGNKYGEISELPMWQLLK